MKIYAKDAQNILKAYILKQQVVHLQILGFHVEKRSQKSKQTVQIMEQIVGCIVVGWLKMKMIQMVNAI